MSILKSRCPIFNAQYFKKKKNQKKKKFAVPYHFTGGPRKKWLFAVWFWHIRDTSLISKVLFDVSGQLREREKEKRERIVRIAAVRAG